MKEIKFAENLFYSNIFPKSAFNFMACVGGVAYYLSRCFIQKIKPTSLGYLELEWFGDWSTYGRFRGMVKIATWVE